MSIWNVWSIYRALSRKLSAPRTTVGPMESSAAAIALLRRHGERRRSDPRLGRVVFALEPRHHLAGRRHMLHRADALAAAPDVLPRLGLGVAARAEIHLRRIGDRQVVGIEPRAHHTGA